MLNSMIALTMDRFDTQFTSVPSYEKPIAKIKPNLE